jgi:hypothetical protein
VKVCSSLGKPVSTNRVDPGRLFIILRPGLLVPDIGDLREKLTVAFVENRDAQKLKIHKLKQTLFYVYKCFAIVKEASEFTSTGMGFFKFQERLIKVVNHN